MPERVGHGVIVLRETNNTQTNGKAHDRNRERQLERTREQEWHFRGNSVPLNTKRHHGATFSVNCSLYFNLAALERV